MCEQCFHIYYDYPFHSPHHHIIYLFLCRQIACPNLRANRPIALAASHEQRIYPHWQTRGRMRASSPPSTPYLARDVAQTMVKRSHKMTSWRPRSASFMACTTPFEITGGRHGTHSLSLFMDAFAQSRPRADPCVPSKVREKSA